MKQLLSAYPTLKLKNRVVMAPMTRSRATGNIPNDLMADYYAQRASVGLIITEGTSPSANGLGYARIPGLFNAEHVKGWKLVTDRVHAQGAKIFVQLMHCGRVAHPENMPAGTQMLGPSPEAAPGSMYTDSKGMLPHPNPKMMTMAEIQSTQAEYVKSCELAIQAGFDGVELHGANGYLIEQFLNPSINKRTDEYGATPAGRMRFLLEIATQAAQKIGPDKVGVRLSPYGAFNGTEPAFTGVDQFFTDLSQKLGELKLAYLHIVDHSSQGAPTVPDTLKVAMQKSFGGTFIRSGGYDSQRAESDLSTGKADLVAFGRPLISNPNLISKWKEGQELKPMDAATLYTPGPKGYTDY